MKKFKLLHIAVITAALFIIAGDNFAFSQNRHIKDLDSLRTSMADLGSGMPDMIRNAKPTDIRTLERVFEINTYALTTIEAYFKMLRVAVSAEGPLNKEVIAILNEWLKFINRYCKSDIDYFDEALSETKDKPIADLITRAKNNIERLSDVTLTAIDENSGLVKNY